jgi:hypothetical protein
MPRLFDHLRRRTNKRHASRTTLADKILALSQEAVTGMDSIGPVFLSDAQDFILVKKSPLGSQFHTFIRQAHMQ